MKGGRLEWRGTIKPSVISDTYTVQIVMLADREPVVTVLDPQLQRRPGEELPHIYKGDHPCVYTRGEWGPDSSLARTVLPWLSAWLIFYEIWLAIGTFHGDGHGDPERQVTAASNATPDTTGSTND